MAKGPGRNDPCPCGSGKKYKKCCRTIPGIPFSEDDALGELLVSSKEFRAFYKAERDKVARKVYWSHSRDLGAGIRGRSTTYKDGRQVVFLSRCPASLDDAMLVAHELEHLVLRAEGFPGIGAKPDRHSGKPHPATDLLATAISSTILDPVVNRRLQTYGFDLWEDYQGEVNDSMVQLRDPSSKSSDDLTVKTNVFNYASKILDWELAGGRSREVENRFMLWFNERYPTIAEEGGRVVGLVERMGYNNPGEVTALFGEIIRGYDLGKYGIVCGLPSKSGA